MPWTGLAEEDSAELAISTAISASVLALSAYDHAARQVRSESMV